MVVPLADDCPVSGANAMRGARKDGPDLPARTASKRLSAVG